jgi:hypothetical protein
MSKSMDSAVVLTVRGTLVPTSLEAARQIHNESAGSQPGIAAARALGDLSHSVYAPWARTGQSSTPTGELLFVDRWDNPKGILEFFSNPHVQGQAGQLFSARDATVWMAAQGAFSYHLPAPASKPERYVGVIRANIQSAEQAIEIFAAVDRKAQRDARRRGMLSHELFIKLAAPGETAPLELLGLDLWCDAAGMNEHYSDPHMSGLRGAFAGPPQASTWEQASGIWSEW